MLNILPDWCQLFVRVLALAEGLLSTFSLWGDFSMFVTKVAASVSAQLVVKKETG